MNKIYFIIIPIVLLIAFALTYQANCSKKDIISINYVDEIVETTITDITYENSSLEEKKDIIYNLLTRLKKEKYILNFSYDEKNHQFSFAYTDKSLGGIKLNKLNSKIGDIPID